MAGKRYSPEEDRRIRELAAVNFTALEIGRLLGRSTSGVAERSGALEPPVPIRGERILGLRRWLLGGGRVIREDHPTLGITWSCAHRSGEIAMAPDYLEAALREGLLVPDGHHLAAANVYRYKDAV